MAARRTTPSIPRLLAVVAGAAGIGFGSTAVAQRHGARERPVPVVAERRVARIVPLPPAKPKPKPDGARMAPHRSKPHHVAVAPPKRRPRPVSTPAPSPAPAPAPAVTVAQAPAQTSVPVPTLQAPAQAPAPAASAPAPAPAPIVSGAS